MESGFFQIHSKGWLIAMITTLCDFFHFTMKPKKNETEKSNPKTSPFTVIRGLCYYLKNLKPFQQIKIYPSLQDEMCATLFNLHAFDSKRNSKNNHQRVFDKQQRKLIT